MVHRVKRTMASKHLTTTLDIIAIVSVAAALVVIVINGIGA